jgi:hypothetical protein
VVGLAGWLAVVPAMMMKMKMKMKMKMMVMMMMMMMMMTMRAVGPVSPSLQEERYRWERRERTLWADQGAAPRLFIHDETGRVRFDPPEGTGGEWPRGLRGGGGGGGGDEGRVERWCMQWCVRSLREHRTSLDDGDGDGDRSTLRGWLETRLGVNLGAMLTGARRLQACLPACAVLPSVADDMRGGYLAGRPCLCVHCTGTADVLSLMCVHVAPPQASARWVTCERSPSCAVARSSRVSVSSRSTRVLSSSASR